MQRDPDLSASTRLLARFREAAETVFMDGSTPWEVDEAMVNFGFATGPFEAEDEVGLDITRPLMRAWLDMYAAPARRRIPLAGRMLELGKLGRKTGAGWYRYPGGGGKVDDPIVADLALEECHFEGRTRTDYAEPAIRERILLALINEAAGILGDGQARTARDLDELSLSACGFPPERGGIMHHADGIGAARIIDSLKALMDEDPIAWAPAPLLRWCAATGTPLADAPAGNHPTTRRAARPA